MYKDKIEGMEDGKDKELLTMLSDGKPYVKKCDGYAIKVKEDKEITYKDYNDQELTLKVPKGSYIVAEGDNCCPKIVTAEEFEKKNKFLEEKETPKKEKGVTIGIESLITD